MACGCAQRMRGILKLAGYKLDDGVWTKGVHTVPDDRVEEDHFRVFIESMSTELFGARASAFMRRLNQ